MQPPTSLKREVKIINQRAILKCDLRGSVYMNRHDSYLLQLADEMGGGRGTVMRDAGVQEVFPNKRIVNSAYRYLGK